MIDPIDMVEMVSTLPTRSRGRACIVLTHDYGGQKAWSDELAQQTDSVHLDLLERFSEDAKLGALTSQFMVSKLFDFLVGVSEGQVLIVSGMEFLRATWIGQPNAVSQFAAQVQSWKKTPGLVFVLQHDKALDNFDFGRHPQYTFVVDQKETLALL